MLPRKCWPIRSLLGCVRRMPSGFMIVTKSTWASRCTDVAYGWSVFVGSSVRMASRTDGESATTGHRHGLASRRVLGLAAVTDIGEERTARDHDRDKHGLHGKQLTCQAAGSWSTGEAHGNSVPGGRGSDEGGEERGGISFRRTYAYSVACEI